MASGLKTLHQIDSAIARTRAAVEETVALTRRASEALADVKRREAAQYGLIAKDRLTVLESGEGGALGYVDRQAERLLQDHETGMISVKKRVNEALSSVETVEAERRKVEQKVNRKIDQYDKAAAAAELIILEDPAYKAQIDHVTKGENQVLRASEKQELAATDEQVKGAPFLSDPFFNYLNRRGYGTKAAKGWFLTKMLDGWVSRRVGYRKSAETYRRLTAIPVRLARHVEALEEKLETDRAALEHLESNILTREGVTALREASLKAQQDLEAVDVNLEAAENALRGQTDHQSALISGETGPLKDAIEVISKTLAKANARTLRTLTAQTISKTDDEALEALKDLSRVSKELSDDYRETQRLMDKYRHTLKDLEKVRRKFKSRRYDAPSSDFVNGDLITSLLGQVIAGALASDDFWKQLARFQRTLKRYSDTDFGGRDWTEGLRLPQSGGDWGDIFGNSSGRSRSSRRRTRSSFPRTPRVRLPRSSGGRSGGGRSGGGGFRTGGGF